VTVRIAYFLTAEGDESIDATGEASGAGTLGAIEDRAAQDLQAVRDCVGWQPSWASLDPVVIDCQPSAAQPAPSILADRYVYEIRFDLLTRAALPGSYGPSLT